MTLDPLDRLDLELEEHRALVHVMHCAQLVLAYHDGPRDGQYDRLSESAWEILRATLTDPALEELAHLCPRVIGSTGSGLRTCGHKLPCPAHQGRDG